MTAHLACYGRLGGDPRAITTKTGTPMTAGTLAVDVAEDVDSGPLWLNLVAFGALADVLVRHQKGDCLSAAGRLQLRSYTTRDGEERQQWQIVVDSIVSARTVRPGGGRKRAAKRGEHVGELVP